MDRIHPQPGKDRVRQNLGTYFDTNTNTSLDNGSDDGSLGLYRGTLTVARMQQFSLPFSF